VSDQITAVILAAGAGTRMKSARAKVLHQIAGRPLVGHALEAVQGLGATQVVVVVGHQHEHVGDAVTALDPDVIQVVQHEQNGTGHAVRVALEALSEPPMGTVLVTYADVPLLTTETLSDVLATHRAQNNSVTILTAELDDPTGYGRIVRDDSGAVLAIREHKDASEIERALREVNSGIVAVDAAFLTQALGGLEATNAQGELYLTDIVEAATARNLPVGAHVLEDVWQTQGVNDRVQLAAVGHELNRRILEHWMREGVTVVDPASTWIDSAVELAADVTILPGTQLLGATSVAEGATVGPDTTLRNVEVGEQAEVVRTHGSDAVIGSFASVGPFAYLRPGAVIDTAAKVGTYVEVKNSHIGAGAKVPHLSYIGDADIGEHTNIGAGAITANYDGQNKHRTEIGKHVKIGCDNVFVAPVRVGDGAYTGAGTIVRFDVPAGSLAVPEAGQRTIENWVRDNRSGTPAAAAADESPPK
jgi:bifunctional UDP-N-acetylglucosamine pyrophosphorylase / glucosamine-1-phosphate N-acetyltransferase